jgi:hypothetical protein
MRRYEILLALCGTGGCYRPTWSSEFRDVAPAWHRVVHVVDRNASRGDLFSPKLSSHTPKALKRCAGACWGPVGGLAAHTTSSPPTNSKLRSSPGSAARGARRGCRVPPQRGWRGSTLRPRLDRRWRARPPPPPSSPPANPFHATQPASPTRSPGGNCDERDGGASDAGTGGGDGGGASAGCGLCGPAVKRFQEGRRWWCCTFTLTPL